MRPATTAAHGSSKSNRDDEHHESDRGRDKDRPGQRQTVEPEEHARLVALAEPQAMIGRGGHEEHGAHGRAEERGEVGGAVRAGELLEAKREWQGELEREQHLSARQHDVQLVEHLEQLAVDALLAILGRRPSG